MKRNERLREGITDLMRCRPDDWPEILAAQAGAACFMDPWPLDLLADAADQIATTARILTDEDHGSEP